MGTISVKAIAQQLNMLGLDELLPIQGAANNRRLKV